MYIHKESNIMLSSLSDVCRWLVQNHNIARPESSVDLPNLMLEFGVEEYIPAPHILTQAEIILQLTQALEQHYDSKAQEKRYDNRLTCALRAGYAGVFQPEGTAFAIWMDSCNAYSYQVMADCQSALRTIPTAAELISELPLLVWP